MFVPAKDLKKNPQFSQDLILKLTLLLYLSFFHTIKIIIFLKRLRHAKTVPEINRLEDFARLVLGPLESRVWASLNKTRHQRCQFLEYELETKWEWPLSGPLPVVLAACKSYAEELGVDHPMMKEFIKDASRLSGLK